MIRSPRKNQFTGLRRILSPEPQFSSRRVWELLKVRLLIRAQMDRIRKLEDTLAEPKPREFRAVIQIQVVEQLSGYSGDSQPVWTQRMLVIPFARIKAFDLDAVLESMVSETIDMTAE